MKGRTTQPGFVNRNSQVVIRNTHACGSDYGQSIYQMACVICGCVYGTNGSEIFERKCPACQGGQPGPGYTARRADLLEEAASMHGTEK